MSTLSINCFLLGSDSSEVFEVEILTTKKVSSLKDLIKAKQSPRLNHVVASELTVWKVSLPVDTITPGFPVDGIKALRSVEKISSVFGEDEVDEHVHILVQVPAADSNLSDLSKADDELTLFCWVLNVSDDPLPVDIGKFKTVGHLKEMIKKEKELTFAGIEADTLNLWKLSPFIPSAEIGKKLGDVQSPQRIPECVKLNAVDELSEHFSSAPRKHLHIIVEAPPTLRQNKRKHDDPPSALKRLKMEIAEAPSHLSTPSRFQKIVGAGHAITLNRPFEPFTIPLVLLHEAFAIFKDRCQKAPSEQALICLSELVPVACEWHGQELARRKAIQSIIARHTGLHFHEQKVPGTEFTTDANLAIIVMPAAIRECKNEHGAVLNQVILYYANFLCQAHNSDRHFYNFNTRFPSILMVDMGTYLGFYGAVWDGERIRVEPLTTPFDLSTHSSEIKARYAIAASLDALTFAVSNIEAHYNSIAAEANVNPAAKRYDVDLKKARGYPFLTSYEDNGQEIKFMYNKRLHDEKLVFSAAVVDQPDSDEFVVKFTPWYSEDAHTCLASRNLAPRLRLCVRISADWIAVIMDKSQYCVTLGLQLSDADKEKIRLKVTSAVRMLHQEGFVHGDIREGNILVDTESLGSDDVKIQLLDFEWAGPIGEAKYPAGVNKITVRRPKGVMGGGLITEQHDIDMASFLFA